MIDLSVLQYPTFRAAVVGGTLYRIGAGATPFLLPLLFQLGFGLDPFHSGLLTCTVAVGAMFMKTLTRLVLSRYGFRRVLIVNSIIGSIGMALYGAFTAQTPHWVVISVLIATHNIEIVTRLQRRVLTLVHGRLVRDQPAGQTGRMSWLASS